MRRFSTARLIFILIFLFLSFGGSTIFASFGNSLGSAFCSNDTPTPEFGWRISDMDIAAQVRENGEVLVQEKITANFDSYKHGIYRTIPLLFEPKGTGYKTSNFSKVSISDIHVTQDGENTMVSKSIRKGVLCPQTLLAGEYNDEEFIKIGDPDKTITGEHSYVISYVIKNALRDDKGYPELYWNMIGNGWGVPIDNASIRLSREGNISFYTENTYCYAGPAGSTDSSNCNIFLISDKAIDFGVKGLGPHEGVTVQVAINPESSTQIASNVTGTKDRTSEYILSKWYYIFTLAPFLYFFYVWYQNGRDPKTRGIIAPRFDAPDGLSPARVGVILDQEVNNVDIASTIISIAQKGWMNIKYEKGGILGIGEDYIFIKSSPDKERIPLTEEEQILYSGIFSSKYYDVINSAFKAYLKDSKNLKEFANSSAAATQNTWDNTTLNLTKIPGLSQIISDTLKSEDDPSSKSEVRLSSLKYKFYPVIDEAKAKLYSWAVTAGYLKSTPGPIQSIFLPGYLIVFVLWYFAITQSSLVLITLMVISTIASIVVLFVYRFYTMKAKLCPY
ncbi:MAG: DUF2207 domain-containing protein [Patescibacteria group bacterium]